MNSSIKTVFILFTFSLAAIFPSSCSAALDEQASSGEVEIERMSSKRTGRTFIAKYVDLEKDPDYPIRTSGTEEPGPKELAVMEEAHLKWIDSMEKHIFTYDPASREKRVPTIVHIIKPSETSTANEAEYTVEEQIEILNDAFSDNDMGFYFDLVATRTHVNSKYWKKSSKDATKKWKSNTREGGMNTLNIWFGNLGDGILGYATYPSSNDNPEDGVFCLHSTVAGGSRKPYNEGATLIHEVGHWLGLYHSFEGGCGKTGDRVSDTSPEKSSAYGCPIGRDTCKGDGKDPIHNYMDYTDDQCLDEFTEGQALRANSSWDTYRATDDDTEAPSTNPTESSEVECIDSPLQIQLETTGDSTILFPCNLMVEGVGGASCNSSGSLVSHCPLACGTCSEQMCKDSKGDFIYDKKVTNCSWLRDFSDKKRKKKCRNNSVLRYTCRASCEYCS